VTNKDKEIWENYVRTLKAVKGKRKVAVAKSTADKKAARKNAAMEPLKIEKISTGATLRDVGLERRREKSLRDGDIEIDAKLDLHGMTQVEAFATLAGFMKRVTKSGKRNLLIITGKGPGGKGVLRENLRGWLAQIPEGVRILVVRAASAKHGGDGAFYVLMKRSTH
jgi:DNA-nicking Smr family endonuclease